MPAIGMMICHIGTEGIFAAHEYQQRHADRGEHVRHEQDQRADRARPEEGVLRQSGRRRRNDHVHDVDDHGAMTVTTPVAAAGRAPPGVGRPDPALAEGVPRHRVDHPRRADRAGQAAAERGHGRARRDDVADPGADVGRPEVAEQRRRRAERLDARRRRAEAHHLRRGHDHVVDAAEDRHAEDRARDVPRRVVRLLAERGGRLEPRERQEPEHHAEEQRRHRRCRAPG